MQGCAKQGHPALVWTTEEDDELMREDVERVLFVLVVALFPFLEGCGRYAEYMRDGDLTDVAGVADIETTLECVDTAVERADEAEIGGV